MRPEISRGVHLAVTHGPDGITGRRMAEPECRLPLIVFRVELLLRRESSKPGFATGLRYATTNSAGEIEIVWIAITNSGSEPNVVRRKSSTATVHSSASYEGTHRRPVGFPCSPDNDQPAG
jgi:hypothetical protein